MTKQKDKGSDFVADWSNVIQNMKVTVERFYKKSDKRREKPFKVVGIRTHFETGEKFVHFYELRIDEPIDYVLEKGDFLELFDRVVKEV